MDVAASLVPRTVRIHGDEGESCEVRFHNARDSAEEFSFQVTGEAAAWVSVFPRSVTVDPGAEGVARLVVRVSPADLGARSVPFAVEVVPTGDSGASLRVEGLVERAPSVGVDASLTPRNSRARRSAEHVLRIENQGTSTITVTPRGMAPDDGLRLKVDPPSLTIAPGSDASARVTVRARKLVLLGGRERARPFEMLVETEGAPAARAEGVLHQQPAVPRGLPLALVGLLMLAVAGVGFGVASSNDADTVANEPNPAEPTSARNLPPVEQHGRHSAAACPTDQHTDSDPLAHAQTPSQLRKLPRDYSFMYPAADRCQPARFNPCEPVHYAMNAALAPPGGLADARGAIAQLAKATGLTFVEDPMTNETIIRGIRQPYQPERYGSRWAPVLIVWERLGSDPNSPQAAGRGGPYVSRPEGVITSGAVGLNVDAVTDRKTGARPRDGFRAERLGVGAIGPEGVTWGRVLLHELAHVVGLGHSSDRAQLMYPEATEQTTRLAEYGAGDLAGLRVLGRQSGCLRTPPPLRPAG